MTLEKQPSPARADKLVLARNRTIDAALSSSPTRRGFLAGFVAALSVGLFAFAAPNHAQTTTTSDTDVVVVAQAPATRQAAEEGSIRPFKVQVPQAALVAMVHTRSDVPR
jgi:hypothetical protein